MIRRSDQSGLALPWLLSIILAVSLAVTMLIAVLAYNSRSHYKNESDKISAAAVEAAKKQQAIDLQKKFDEDNKKPYKTFTGPQAAGSISFNYPKTWSGYVDTSNTGEPINGYFYPDIVPGTQGNQTAYALRIELLSTDYSSVLQSYSSKIKAGSVIAKAYIPPKMKGVTNAQVGTMLTGSITSNFTGTMFVVRVRDKTLEISAQSVLFNNDFNNIILKSLTYTP